MPINVTLLFSCEQYLAAAEAVLHGIERRIAAGLNPDVASVASLFISRWDVAVMNKVPETLRDQLGIAIAKRTYKAYRKVLGIILLAARLQCRRTSSTSALGKHWNQGSQSLTAGAHLKALDGPFYMNYSPGGTLGKAFLNYPEIKYTFIPILLIISLLFIIHKILLYKLS